VCFYDALLDQNVCLKQCPAKIYCHELCFSIFSASMNECPCFDSQQNSTTEQPATTTTTSTTTSMTTTTTTVRATTSTFLETSTTVRIVEPSEFHILVIPKSPWDSFITSGDGSYEVRANITVPGDEFLVDTKSALIKGHLHVFGGRSDSKKIAVLVACEFKELSARLQDDRNSYSEALSIIGGSIALVCFNYDNPTSCELFNGTHTETTYSTTLTHGKGGLGIYKQQPATVGCRRYAHGRAEALTASGWSDLPEHPLRISAHSLVGLENESMLLIYGVHPQNQYQQGIWQLRDDVWSRIGEMQQASAFGCVLKSGPFIYLAGGFNGYRYTRVDLNAQEEIVNEEILGGLWTGFYPHLFEVSSSYCV